MTDWTKRDLQWFEQLPEEGPPTHEIVWQPVFRIRIALPPWGDPDDVLEQLCTSWNDGVPEDLNYYEREAPPAWVTDFEFDGSVQTIEEVES